MKKLILSLIIIVSLFFSCKKTDDTSELNNSDSITNKEALYTTANTLGYLEFDKEFNEYKIIGIKEAQKFTSSEMEFKLKENEFEVSKSEDLGYYTIHTFDIDKTNFKVILYSSYGDNDSNVVNIQLNSYQSGVQVDALLLDCRLVFETEYYRDFSINKDKTIEIKKMAIDKYEHNENGDIIGDKAVSDTLVTVAKYKIDDLGKFITN